VLPVFSGNDLEKFAMKTLSEPEAGPMEEHLLVCRVAEIDCTARSKF